VKLRLEHICKSFTKDKFILNDISLSIDEGEFVVFLGPSGCGKTTLLRIIAGLEKEDKGKIYFDDVEINNFEPKDRNIGMVFQNYALYPHLSVYDNIAFPLKINGIKKAQIEQRVKEISEFIGLSEFLQYKPKQLSGGQKQRVALGRAISRNPKLFLFDEPLSNLDAKLRAQMRTELYKLHRELKTTSIYVTHDQVEAMTMADKIVVLNNGTIQQIGTPSEVYKKPANLFVASFIGNPQINLFDVEISINDNHYVCNVLNQNDADFSFIFPNNFQIEIYRLITQIGIRPESIYFEKNDVFQIKFGRFKIFSIEYMGNESIVNFETSDGIKSFRVTNKLQFKENEMVDLYINQNDILFFDNNGNKVN
jgi:multiple sugar transport system ATP-binding protein